MQIENKEEIIRMRFFVCLFEISKVFLEQIQWLTIKHLSEVDRNENDWLKFVQIQITNEIRIQGV